MELARRGYVVLSPDLQGGGESDPSVDRSIQAKTVAEYANSLSYVEKRCHQSDRLFCRNTKQFFRLIKQCRIR